MLWTALIPVVGFLVSLYGVYVEHKAKNKSYKALCDINDHISCSKALTSKYGTTFGLPNGVWGLMFYALVTLLFFFGQFQIIFYLAILSVLGSGYLAYILITKLKDFCLICLSIYLVNLTLLIAISIQIY